MSFFPGQGQQHSYPPPQQYPPQGYGPPPPQGYGPPPPQGYGPPPPQFYGGPPPQGQPPPNGYPPQGYSGYPPPQGGPSPPSGYGGYQPPPPQQPPRPYSGAYQATPPVAGSGYRPPVPGGPQYGGRPGLPTVSSNAFVQGDNHAPRPPPAGPHSFNAGPNVNYQYQYSNCTGRRKALLIGINYFRQKSELRGCINDVKNMSNYLNGNFGYAREDMVILTDDQHNPMSQPTRQNILRAMHWLVKDAQPNDSLFFHYSGHGGQKRDEDGDEDDGYDEVIYPVDFQMYGENGSIVDDEMHRIMVQSLRPGVRLTAIFDSCHSGSALDLPYIYSTQGLLKEPNLAKEAGQGLLTIMASWGRGDIGSMASTALNFFKKATTGEEVQERNRMTKTSPADVIMWSGSKDDQTSQDANIAGQATGAMSWAFISALKKNPQQSYVGLLNSIRDELNSKYTQKPQLSCSHPLDTNLLYVM